MTVNNKKLNERSESLSKCDVYPDKQNMQPSIHH